MIEILIYINKSLLQYFNSFSNKQFIENIVYIFSDIPIFFLPIFLIGYWLYYNYKHENNKKYILLNIFYAIVFSISISIIIQLLPFNNLDRPEQHLINSGKLLLTHIPDTSFPSDHATVSFAFFTGLLLSGYKKIAFAYLPFLIIMNLSRIIAGVHWPFDILAGTIIGTIGAYISIGFCNKNQYINKLNLLIIKISSYIKL